MAHSKGKWTLSWLADVVNRAVASPSAVAVGYCGDGVATDFGSGMTATHVAATSVTGRPSMALSR